MKLYETEIYAICPKDRIIKVFTGPLIPGRTILEARKYCRNNGLDYCKITKQHEGRKIFHNIKQVTQ